MNTCHFLYSHADVDDDETMDEDGTGDENEGEYESDSVTGDYDDEMCLNKFDSIKYTFENELK